jgi:hypothetical protein
MCNLPKNISDHFWPRCNNYLSVNYDDNNLIVGRCGILLSLGSVGDYKNVTSLIVNFILPFLCSAKNSVEIHYRNGNCSDDHSHKEAVILLIIGKNKNWEKKPIDMPKKCINKRLMTLSGTIHRVNRNKGDSCFINQHKF